MSDPSENRRSGKELSLSPPPLPRIYHGLCKTIERKRKKKKKKKEENVTGANGRNPAEKLRFVDAAPRRI